MNVMKRLLSIVPFVLLIGSLCGSDREIKWGFSDRQGKRPTMEDAFAHVKQQLGPYGQKADYFVIFDGHGGSQAAIYAAQLAPMSFLWRFNENFKKYPTFDENITASFKDSFLEIDKAIVDQRIPSGTTALAALVAEDDIYVAWAGDSRGIVFDQNGIIRLATIDHKPDSPVEKERLALANVPVREYTLPGFSIHRIGATRSPSMAVSRALGDRRFKELYPKGVIADVEILKTESGQGTIVVLACDGLWDVLSNDDVAKFVVDNMKLSVKELLEKFPDNRPEAHESTQEHCSEETPKVKAKKACRESKLTLIARGLRDLAVDKGSLDNVSVLVVNVE